MKWRWSNLFPETDVQPSPVGSDQGEPSIWIFGYGSLIWNPGFRFAESRKCVLRNFSRKFWQGNMTHRGDQKLPGRVVTIVPEEGSLTSGLVFRVSGLEAIASALDHLYHREVESGYVYQKVTVDCLTDNDGLKAPAAKTEEKLFALTCRAKSDNPWYLGPATTVAEMAYGIAVARGAAGPNSEYLLKLATWSRKLFPTDDDTHLFELEALVLKQLCDTN